MRSRPTIVYGGCLLTLPALLVGCGRKATREDCQLLLDKTVELAIRDLKDASAEDIQEAQTKRRGQLDEELRDCQGRRVTDGMMQCVRNAKTSEELSKCVD